MSPIVSASNFVPFTNILADGAPSSALWLLPWVISGALVVLGLFVYGWSDLVRTHWRRVWAIAGVCIIESRRRRVLWLTPLAILGIVTVSQFQQPTDYQDAIRQTTKFCLFASGMLVTVTAIILACTNLPREIENRVIYTIVTKPTTRLEIILGKVLGYACVSAMMIVIMGGFTLVFLHLRARPMIAALKDQMASLPAESPIRTTNEYYIQSGLLGTRSLEWGQDAQVYAEPPDANGERWSLGWVGQYILIPFDLTPDDRDIIATSTDKDIPLYLNVSLDVKQHPPDEQERRQAHDMGLDKNFNIPLPTTSTSDQFQQVPLTPEIQVRYVNATNHAPLIKGMDPMNAGHRLALRKGSDEHFNGNIQVPPDVLREAAKTGRFMVQISPNTPGTEFGVRGKSAMITIPVSGIPPIQMASDSRDPSQPAPAEFGAYPIREGIRLTPLKKNLSGPVAVFPFHKADIIPSRDGNVAIQISVQIERTAEFKDDEVGLAAASLQVVNRKTGDISEERNFSPETSRTSPVSIPLKYVDGGDFDVILRDKMPGANLAFETGQGGTIALVSADRDFSINLAKSLFILWLMAVLVVIIAIFCSTFVSWPIAVILTLVILLSHWGVEQLGSSLNWGQAGRQATTTFGIRDPATSAVVEGIANVLSYALEHLSDILPDVGKFPVIDDIQHGVSIPLPKVLGALGVIFCYGLPMLVFSYVILRQKEVAP